MKYPRKVYAIRHNVTDRVYIGSSCNVDRRFKQHLYALQAHTHVVDDMQKDYDEHGEDFTLTILDTINDESEIEKEYEWMDKYQSFTRGVGYNYKDLKRRAAARSASEQDGELSMKEPLTGNERELLDIIRESEDPAQAMITAVLIIAQFLSPQSVTEFITHGQTPPHSMN